MNWQIFSIFGYLGAALWLSVPLLWLVYWHRQQPWLRYLATALTLAAFVCAKINSATHVNRIETIPSGTLTERGSREEAIRQAALEGRSSEVAQITFAEDGAGEFLDKAGMDEADLKYLGGSDKSSTPEWKRQKQSRSQNAAKDDSPDDKLDAQIGGPQEGSGVDVGIAGDSKKKPPLLMSEADFSKAHRLDRWNLGITRFLILAAVLLLAVDYLRRANNYASASLPLPLPSAWLNSFNPMPPVVIRPQPPRRTIPAELEWLARRGDAFVYMTDSPEASTSALAHLQSLPQRCRPQVLRVTDEPDCLSDEFVFESLWYGRGSFIVDSIERMEYMLPRFIKRLEQRRATRARVSQTVHFIWDVSVPLPEPTREAITKLAQATGFSLQLS